MTVPRLGEALPKIFFTLGAGLRPAFPGNEQHSPARRYSLGTAGRYPLLMRRLSFWCKVSEHLHAKTKVLFCDTILT